MPKPTYEYQINITVRDPNGHAIHHFLEMTYRDDFNPDMVQLIQGLLQALMTAIQTYGQPE